MHHCCTVEINPPSWSCGHTEFSVMSLTLSFSTLQAFSFDTHIKGVDKKIHHPPSCGDGHFESITILSIAYCIVTRTKGVCKISAQSDVKKWF